MCLIYCLLSKIIITIYSWTYQISVNISNLPPVVCRRAHVLHTLFVFVCSRIAVSNTYCVVFLFCLSSSCVPYVASFSVLCFVCLRLVYHMLPVSLCCVLFVFVLCTTCCQFLWIVHFKLPLRLSLAFCIAFADFCLPKTW
jgi:hypothetical protein